MKHLITVLLLILSGHGELVRAQQALGWIKIAPSDERFQALMPQEPRTETAEHNYVSSHGPRRAIGKAYSTSFEGSTYTIWSLDTMRAPSDRVDEMADFLDEYADFVRESLLKSARDPLPPTAPVRMAYKSELSMGVIPGREYSLTIGTAFGATQFYMDGARLYVLLALRSDGDAAPIQNFFSGFLAKSPTETPFLPVPATVEAGPIDQVYAPSETTTKAKVLSKPEPQYTEAARKYGVTGTVALRGVISTDGRVISIQVVKRLPHGLTQASVAAAKRSKFTPAVKDGLTVPQLIHLEYNFSLF